MMDKLCEIGDYTENGFQTVISSGSWRVAYLNNTTDEKSKITYFERHRESDEVFVLVAGSARLILSPDGCGAFERQELAPLVMYSALKTSYHAIEMDPGCRVLLVENVDVGKENSSYHYLTDAEAGALTAILK